MPQADYRIVPYRPEHRTQVIELQKELWSPSAELNAAYLAWKHLRNPYLSEPLLYLVMHGERVVGMRGFFGTQWQFGSPPQMLVVPCAGDMLIASDHRNRGLMTRVMRVALQELAKKGFTYVFSFNAGSTTLLGQMAMGWRSAGSLQPMQRTVPKKKSLVRAFLEASPRVVSVYRKLQGHERKAPPASPNEPPRNHFNVFDMQSDRCGHKIGAHVSIEKTQRPHEMAELVARLGYDGRIRHVQDEPYFAWRFQNPRSNYRFLFWDDARLEGYLVLQATPLPWIRPVSIVDWQASTRRVQSELLQTAIQLLGSQAFCIWSATLEEEQRQLFDAAGFKLVERAVTKNPQAALVRPVRDEMLKQEWLVGKQRLLDLSNWDLRMIYSEGF